MNDDRDFLRAIQRAPNDDGLRLVYADWLDEQNDIRGSFVRLHLALQALSPDHLHFVSGEQELSYYRKKIDSSWLAIIEGERDAKYPFDSNSQPCSCFAPIYQTSIKWKELELHNTPQNTECDEWLQLLERIEDAVVRQVSTFDIFPPKPEASPNEHRERVLSEQKIVTLPAEIAKLQSVKRLRLSSFLERLPPEIGELTQLENLDAYMVYRLHWLPYELTRCMSLRDSSVSTRALYGNYKYHPPFPRLMPQFPYRGGQRLEPEKLTLQHFATPTHRPCSVCRKLFLDQRRHRVWITLTAGTDDWPLLVNACSPDCIAQLPAPSERSNLPHPHRGGLSSRPPQ